MYPWNWYNLGYDLGNLVYDLETARPSVLLIMEPQKFCCQKKKKVLLCEGYFGEGHVLKQYCVSVFKAVGQI